MSEALSAKPGDRREPRATARWRRLRFIPLFIGAAAMALGLASGLTRLGVPVVTNSVTDLHGALMIAGFLGTLISLERAVAYGRAWGYLAPGLSAAGAVTLLIDTRAAAALFTIAGAVLFLTSALLAFRHVAIFSIALAVAALCWTIGSALWLVGYALPDIVLWWLSFLILTIAAERLELSRILRIPLSRQILFVIAMCLILVGSARAELTIAHAPFTIAGFLALAAWLLLHDVARRTVRQPGPPRFSAVAIIAGHGWLGIAGVLLALLPADHTLAYDAVVHTIAIGMVLSMIFAHAPIILPAVTGLRVTASRAAYAPLTLLHLSLILRLVADIGLWPDLRLTSAIATIAALLGYAGILIAGSRLHQVAQPAHLSPTAR